MLIMDPVFVMSVSTPSSFRTHPMTYRTQHVEQILQRGQLRNQLLNNLAEGLVDGMIVDAGEIEGQVDVFQT